MAWTLDLDPATNSRINLSLFRNVKNVREIRKKLFEGKIDCCIIKPSLIIDPFQVAVAANKALTAESFTTKTVFTEILFNLSISKNITSSLHTFGINEEATDLLIATVCKITETANSLDFVDGDEEDVNTLVSLTDMNLVKKVYKISDLEYRTNDLLDSVVSRMAIK